jgi:RNA-directed DNA polymerase
VARSAQHDRTRDLQRTLYRAAKAEPGRRFHALYDKVHRRDVLERAWEQVRRNRGAAGIDRITLADVERYGVDRLLDELARDLKEESYRPLPARRVWIPKPGRVERRPLSIPAVRDRIVQAAVKIVIEPIFESQFLPCSYGFRPGRAPHDALQVLLDQSFQGRRWVVESDIASCFESIPHEKLMSGIEERIADRSLLKLLRAMLRAGVMEEGTVRRADTGTPQGGVLSPLLCNVYLHRLDRAWQTKEHGVLCRFADDLVVMCRTRGEAERAVAALAAALGELGLSLRRDKTRVLLLKVGGEGFDFLGFHHRWVQPRVTRARHVHFLARWPTRQAMQRARDRIRELTARERLLLPVEKVVQDVNAFLRGWAAYFRYGNSARSFDEIKSYALMRLALFVAKRHRRRRGYGWAMVYGSPNALGLISLSGTVVAPRPNWGWREKPNTAGEGRR